MVVLQRPKFAYYDGDVRPWDGAVIHVSSEGLYRGLNVFEGLKAHWQPDGTMGIIANRAHYARLCRSAKLLHIPFEHSFEQFDDAVHKLIAALCVPEKDIWIRATVYLIEGLWGENQRSDLILTAFLTPKEMPEPIKVGVSTWRRATDTMLPARIKTSSNYQVARLARIEGRPRGYSEMILLNNSERVAEAGGACVLIVRDGKVITPPASEGALESITVDIVEALAHEQGIAFERRPIDRTELYIADEMALAGTLAELTPVSSIDGYDMVSKLGLLDKLAHRYHQAVTGTHPHAITDLSTRRYAQGEAATALV
jgi:branched-chain amino acid aminotransferase